AYEGWFGNGSIYSATTIGTGSILADITTVNDVDYYRFTVPSGVSTFSVRVKANEVSLLTPQLTIYNSMQQVVGTASSVDPLNNSVVVQIDNASPYSQYYIKVQGSRQDVFGVGAYRLRVFAGAASDMPAGVANNDFTQGNVLDDNHNNDVLSSATNLDRGSFQ